MTLFLFAMAVALVPVPQCFYKFAVPVAFFVAFLCGFSIFFAAIACGPLAFATRWIWAADIAESIETAAVRAPLCAPFLGFRRSFPRWSRQARVDPR